MTRQVSIPCCGATLLAGRKAGVAFPPVAILAFHLELSRNYPNDFFARAGYLWVRCDKVPPSSRLIRQCTAGQGREMVPSFSRLSLDEAKHHRTERAFELAHSGEADSIDEIRVQLRSEGYAALVLLAPQLLKQLRLAMDEAKPDRQP
jgi:hypothetical protein